MGYVETVLMPGERVKYAGQLHWIIYGPCFAALGLEFALLGSTFLMQGFDDTANDLTVSCLVLAAAAFLKAWLQQVTTEIAVTDRRIISKTGLLQRQTIEMHLDKVESVDVRQSLLGRFLDYGTVVIRGTGAGIEPLAKVAEPLKLRSYVTTG